jgi:hypothetical protein
MSGYYILLSKPNHSIQTDHIVLPNKMKLIVSENYYLRLVKKNTFILLQTSCEGMNKEKMLFFDI